MLVKHWAKIASGSVVILSYIQYSYKYGICKVFRLPVSTVSISLTDYIPSVALFCAIALYVIDLLVALDLQRTNRKTHFGVFRLVCGTAINFMAISIITNYGSLSLFWILLISIVPPLVIEFLLRNLSLKTLKERAEKKYHDWLKTDTEDRQFYKYFIRPGLVCVLILILLIPFLSEVVTRNRNIFEVCTIEEQNYAVVLNASGDVVALPAVIEKDSLTILTGSYRYISKTDIDKIVLQTFDHVIITEGV